jgi:hypothetical protein
MWQVLCEHHALQLLPSCRNLFIPTRRPQQHHHWLIVCCQSSGIKLLQFNQLAYCCASYQGVPAAAAGCCAAGAQQQRGELANLQV